MVTALVVLFTGGFGLSIGYIWGSREATENVIQSFEEMGL